MKFVVEIIVVFVFFASPLAVLSSCTTEAVNDDQESGDEPVEVRLPSMNADEHRDCLMDELYPEEYLAPETYEDWASGVTTVAIGTVVDVEPVKFPAYQSDQGSRDIVQRSENCDQIRVAVDVTLQDVDVLVGPERDELTFRIGDNQITEQFEQRAIPDGQGVIWDEYRDGEYRPSKRGVFEGMRIGARLYTSSRAHGFDAVDDDLLTTAGTWLFEVREGGTIEFQGHDGRPGYCPGEIGYYNRSDDAVRDGLSVEELKENLTDHSPAVDAAESNRPFMHYLFELDDDSLHAYRFGATAFCHIASDEASYDRSCVPGESDCPSGEVCMDGECVEDPGL